MNSLSKIFGILSISIALSITGCPKSGVPDPHEDVYHIGTWSGEVKVEAYLVMREDTDYGNMAWRVEAGVKLDEYSDGSLKGTASGDLFTWEMKHQSINDFKSIAVGHWDGYSQFKIDITGNITDADYTLTAGELPTSLIDLINAAKQIQFWDFLYPMDIASGWTGESKSIMEGTSTIPQGDDIVETSAVSAFREFGIIYTWSIRKL